MSRSRINAARYLTDAAAFYGVGPRGIAWTGRDGRVVYGATWRNGVAVRPAHAAALMDEMRGRAPVSRTHAVNLTDDELRALTVDLRDFRGEGVGRGPR